MPQLFAAVAAFAVIFVLSVVLLFISSRYQKVGPNEALIISGRGQTRINPSTGQSERVGYRIVKGGGTVIWPVLERAERLSLEVMTLEIETPRVYSSQGVAVTVDGIAQVKVKSDEISIATSAEQFLSKSTDEIKQVALQTLEGHLRGIVGTLSVEEIYKDRDRFAQRVQEVSAGDMANMGLGIVSFTIKDIKDEKDYLNSLGVARTAEVKRDAAIGQAMATRDAKIQSASAEQEGEQARFAAQTKIAEADKSYQVQKAAYDAEVNKQKAAAELAYALQQNITNQLVKQEEVGIEVIAKKKQIEVQEQEVARREKELEATIRKPAAAEQYRIQTLADASKYQSATTAAGQSEATRLVGQGEADANKSRGLAQADVIRAQGFAEAEANKARGLAQADVIQAQGFAEAEAMKRKAEAWLQYNQAAIIQQLIEALPKIAAAIAEPLTKTERIVIISNGGADGSGAGASKVSQDVANIISQVPATVEALTGVDIIKTIKDLPGVKSTPEATPSESPDKT
ncbi:Inner membrane protein YqiK [Anaerolineae bacterium]|nr:Inner membrane protein YqiK [Anaerolineae bacterium]